MNSAFIRLTLAALALLAFAQPARAEWYEASSDHFVIYAKDSETDIRKFAENLERYHSAMAVLTKREIDVPSPSNRVVIYVVGGESQMISLARGDRNVGGFYIPRAGGSRAFVQTIRNQSGGYPDVSTIILLHEYAHHFLIASTHFAMPRWMSEGAAEFFAAATFNPDGSLLIGRAAQHRAGDLAFADPVHVRELIDPALYEKQKVKGFDGFYLKSWLLYHYLTFNDARAGQLAAYVTKLSGGMGQREAGEAAFGDLDKLERELKSYVRSRLYSFVLKPEQLRTGTIALRQLTPGEAAIMPMQIRSQRGVDDKEAAKLVVDARAVAARFPDDPGVLSALAEAEYDAGNDEAAIAAADAAIARDPARTNAYVQKGYALFRKAAKAEDPAAAYAAAVRPFVALNKLENDHPLPLIYFYRAQLERGVAPNENARAALERAAVLAPFDHGLQINAGAMLAREGKIAVARAFLAPVAANPHGGPAAARAKQIIAVIAGAPEGVPLDLGNLPQLAEAPEVATTGG
jgi:tetratricopeptide (TPR) repeat protein